MSREERQVEPIKEYYIAYFDLLGYKSFFKAHPDKAETFLKDINEAIQNINRRSTYLSYCWRIEPDTYSDKSFFG